LIFKGFCSPKDAEYQSILIVIVWRKQPLKEFNSILIR
jgi:hypothetical protein